MSDTTTTEKANYGARAGQVIAGNLARGGDGKFSAAGAPAAPSYTKPQLTKRAKRAAAIAAKKAPKGKGEAKAKPKAVDPAKLAARAAKIAEAKKKVEERAKKAEARAADQLKKKVERTADQARKKIEQDKKKAERDAAADQRKVEQMARRAAIDARRAAAEKRRAERLAQAASKPKGSGPGGAKPKPDKSIAQNANRTAVQRETLPSDSFDTLATIARGGTDTPERLAVLMQNAPGMVERDIAGQYRLSFAGRAYLNAANSGDVGRAKDAMSRARDRAAAQADRAAAQADRAVRLAKQRTTKGAQPGLTVLKHASGGYRWVAISSTAFQDRDGQIVSRKALSDDCARADTTGDYGTLNYWHTPIVLGDCDFNMVAGRSLIESGTFRSPAIARAVAATQTAHKMSIGFRHPMTQPENGVFGYIKRFERSLLPAGRESNLFTSLTVKDITMTTMTKEKVAALRGLLDDDSLLVSLLGQAALSEKAADDAGVQFKMADGAAGAAAEEEDMTEDAEEMADMLLSDEELDAIADRVVAKLAPMLQGAATKEAAPIDLAPLTDALEGLKAAQAEELKAFQAKQATTTKALQDRIAELEGSAPQQRPYRASQSAETTTQTTAKAATSGIADDFFSFVGGGAA